MPITKPLKAIRWRSTFGWGGDELIVFPLSNSFAIGDELWVRDALKKYYLDREILPISSYTPTIGPVSEHLDRNYFAIIFQSIFIWIQ